MNERPCGGRGVAEGVNVRHDIMTEPSLVRGDGRKIHIVQVLAHLGDRLVGNLDAERFLRFGEGEP